MKQVLLIEDDPFLIDIYTTKLESSGFGIEIAANGDEGLRKLVEKKFDILILDIILPKTNGWTILEKIREEKEKVEHLNELKIIILSNLSQKEEVEKGLKLGADRYLIKAHYTPSEVVEEIKQLLKQ